ncbi:YbjN domain-containing protein [Sphingobium sp. EM0848]|uniref:YbjN domain-containing protein n=1 Tax=Sphingobium sp. EM0848 TaxID=2743473 RepID=UPI00159CBD32|nr:YbjN domain-containing protein [Sphingobium sp. EM0848]
MKKTAIAAALWAAFMTTSGQAADSDPCGPGLVCANDPQTVVRALQAEGYKAALGKSKTTGNPKIESAASGYDFTIFFYECEQGKNCGSLQFQLSFEDDGGNTPELANKWNKDKRFSQMSVWDDHSLALAYDVTTVGGLNQKNFADVIDWWAVMLGEAAKFFKENPAPAK